MEKSEIQAIAEYYRTKSRSTKKVFRILTTISIFLSIIVLFAKEIPDYLGLNIAKLAWVLVSISFIIQIIAYLLRASSKSVHLISRDAFRWLLITSSIEDVETRTNQPLQDLRQKALDQTKTVHNAESDMPYYQSNKPKGLELLLGNLHESIYYTKSIMELSNNKKQKVLFILIGFLVLLLISCLTLGVNLINPLLLSLTVLSLIVPLIQELIDIFRTRGSINQLYILEERLSNFIKSSNPMLERHLSLIFDFIAKYYSITTDQENLSDKVYQKYIHILRSNYIQYLLNINSIKNE